MESVSLIVTSASLLLGLFSFWVWRTLKPRLHELSSHACDALYEARRGIDQLDRAIDREQIASTSLQILKLLLLELRNNLERRIRRIILFTNDKPQVSASLFWFQENMIPEDRADINRALKYKCIPGRENKNLAKMIVQIIDEKVKHKKDS